MDVNTRDRLLDELQTLQSLGDAESAHWMADNALLAYIADDEIRAAFATIKRWYA